MSDAKKNALYTMAYVGVLLAIYVVAKYRPAIDHFLYN